MFGPEPGSSVDSRSFRQVWRHPLFRRLFAVKLTTQISDGCLQIAMASYILLSPVDQPDARAIAAALAVTLLPFSVIGPFVGVVLDRWNRRQVAVVTDLIRVAIALTLALLVGSGVRAAWSTTTLLVLMLVAMSLNRLLMAGLNASLAHTVERREYLLANSLIAPLGPLGVAVGAVVAMIVRLMGGSFLAPHHADAAIFVLSGIGFTVSVVLALRIERTALGPRVPRTGRFSDALANLRGAVGHLRQHRTVWTALVALGLQRTVYGLVMTAVILIHRNHLNAPDQVGTAIAQLGVWVTASAVGYLLASPTTPLATNRVAVRTWMVAMLVLCGVVQLSIGAIFQHLPLVIASFLLGWASQSVKNCADTTAHAHIADQWRGQVFTVFDMVFNTTLVLGAVSAAILLPPDGASHPVFWGAGVAWLLIAGWFGWASRHIGQHFDAGSHRQD